MYAIDADKPGMAFLPRSLPSIVLLVALAVLPFVPGMASGGGPAPPGQQNANGQQPPSLVAAPSVSGSAVEGSSLTTDGGSWSGPGVKLALQWQRCDSLGNGCADVAGATGSSFLLGSVDVGSTLRVLVTASNRNGSASAVSEPSAVVAPAALAAPTVTPPAPTASPSISGSAVEGQTLQADAGSWSGTQPLSYKFQWQQCDASGGACAAVAKATGQSYSLTANDVGATMRVEVTASNSAGSATAVSAATSVVSSSLSTLSPSPSTLASPLTWAPPALSSPVTVQVQDSGQACPSLTTPWQNPNQPWACVLDSSKDYVLKLGHRQEAAGQIGGLVVTGGRNVVIVGGEITIAAPSDPSLERQGLTFHYQTGTVHVEGVLVDGSPLRCLVLDSSQAVFQIENFRCEGVSMYKENFSTPHSDVLMTWKSPPEIRVDKFTSDFDNSGMALYPQKQADGTTTYPQHVIFKRTNIRNMTTSPCSNFSKPLGGAYVASWRQTRIEVDRMYTETGWGRSSTTSDCPSPGSFQWKISDAWFTYDGQTGYSKSQKLSGDGVSAGSYFEFTNPSYDNVWGVGGALARVTYGIPSGGDYVPRGLAGTNYTTPGYGG